MFAFFYDLESELSRELSGIQPNGERGQVEPELPLRVQTTFYLVLLSPVVSSWPWSLRGTV